MSIHFGKDYFNGVMRLINTLWNCYGSIIIVLVFILNFQHCFELCQSLVPILLKSRNTSG